MKTRPARESTKIYAASLGKFAPDVAVREGRVEVVLVNETGQRQSYGRLVARRQVGGYLVQLADDSTRGMWWVVAVSLTPPRNILVGFRQGRRTDARSFFESVTEDDLHRGTHGLPDEEQPS